MTSPESSPASLARAPSASPPAASDHRHSDGRFTHLCAVTFVLLCALSLVRYLTFHASIYDLGIFHQVLWNTAHGRFFASSLKHMSYLGDHFSPSFALLAPLEWLPFPIGFLVAAQALSVAWTGLNMHALAHRHLAPRPALLVGVATLLCPCLYCPALADIHPEVFMAGTLSAALLALDRDHLGWAAALLVLTLLGKEDAGLLVGAVGLAIAFETRSGSARSGSRRARLLFGLVFGALGFAWTPLAVRVLMPAFQPPVHEGAWFYLGRYSHLGGSLGDIVGAVLLHPFRSFLSSLTAKKAITVGLLATGFGFAPLFGGARLACLVPFAAAHFLSSRWTQFYFPFQYLVPLVPVISWAAIAGAPKTLVRWPRLSSSLVAVVALLSIVWRLDPEPLQLRPEHAALTHAIARVPDGAPVCAENWFGAQLSARPEVEFCVLWEWERAQYRYYRWPEASSAAYQIFDLHDPGAREALEFPSLAKRLAELRAAGAEVLFAEDGVTLLRVSPEVSSRAPASAP